MEKTEIVSLTIASEFFDVSETDWINGLLRRYFAGGLAPDHLWVVDHEDGEVLGAAYVGIDGAYGEPYIAASPQYWNIYFMGVRPEFRKAGRGLALLQHIESHIVGEGGTHLFAETSSHEKFECSRAFCLKNGFEIERTVPEGFGPDEDRVVFRKYL